jgi:hypothetical protein
MRNRLLLLLIAGQVFAATPIEHIEQAINAMGGRAKLEAVHSVRIEALGYTNYVEQSERPEGPYIVSYEKIGEFRDYAQRRVSQTIAASDLTDSRPPAKTVYRDTIPMFITPKGPVQAGPDFARQFDDALDFTPERILLTALAAKDLTSKPDVDLHSVLHHVVEFSLRGLRTRLLLNGDTHLPTAIEWSETYPNSFFWGIWGDVTTRIVYSFWAPSGGINYPLQSDIERNGLPWQTRGITSIKWNVEPTEEIPAPTESIRTSYDAAKKRTIQTLPLAGAKPPAEHVPGITQFFNSWNSTIVRQDDGIVILETPISSGFSAQIIDEAKRRYPGVPIRAAITTSDAWPHLGGLREYVASKIPLYIVDRNRPIVERLIAARFTTEPDALERKRVPAQLRPVSGRTQIGTGKNRIELYPYRTPTGERMMLAYFPEHRLLYASDMVQPRGDGFALAQYLGELASVVQREKLDVTTVFAMHAGAIPWSRIQDEVRKLSAP